MNSLVHSVQIFYKEHVFLLIFYTVFFFFSISGNYFYAHLRTHLFLKKGCLVLSSALHQGYTWLFHSSTTLFPGKPPTLALHSGMSPRLEVKPEKCCGGSNVPETIPLASSDVRRDLQAAARSILHSAICSQKYRLPFFPPGIFCVLSCQEAGGSASGLGKVVGKIRE